MKLVHKFAILVLLLNAMHHHFLKAMHHILDDI